MCINNGFKTRNGDVRPPKSFSTACQLVAVAFQCQSQVQFGGVGSIHLDYDLAPFVKMSFVKHFQNGLKYLENKSEYKIDRFKKWFELNDLSIDNEELKEKHPKVYTYAMDMLENEGAQSAQGLYHNLNTLESRQGSQVPFTSVNLGRDISINFLVSCLDNYIGYDVIDNNSDMIYTAYYDTSLCAENKVLEKVKRKLDEIFEEMTEKNILKGENEDAENC